MWPRPRPDSCGTATPQAATSGASGSVILSPDPTGRVLVRSGPRERGEVHPLPAGDHRVGPALDLAEVHPVEQDRHRQRGHLLVGDLAPGVGADHPVDLAVAQLALVPLRGNHLDRVVRCHAGTSGERSSVDRRPAPDRCMGPTGGPRTYRADIRWPAPTSTGHAGRMTVRPSSVREELFGPSSAGRHRRDRAADQPGRLREHGRRYGDARPDRRPGQRLVVRLAVPGVHRHQRDRHRPGRTLERRTRPEGAAARRPVVFGLGLLVAGTADTIDPAPRRPGAPGAQRWRARRGRLRADRPDLHPSRPTGGLRADLGGLGGALPGRAADLGPGDRAVLLALGVPRTAAAGRRGIPPRAAGEPRPADTHRPARRRDPAWLPQPSPRLSGSAR